MSPWPTPRPFWSRRLPGRGLGLAFALAGLALLGPPPAGADPGRPRGDRLCFSTSVSPPAFHFVLDVFRRGPATVGLVGEVVLVTGTDATGLPAFGSGLFTDAGELDFLVTTGIGTSVGALHFMVTGRLVGPDFESGVGATKGLSLPGPVTPGTFVQVPCPAAVGDFP